ncbi:MAG: hypothetical protein AABX70_08100 [Nanoarchaeota archaeon]
MKMWMGCMLLILLVQIVAVAASDTPISFYDPTTRQNRPIWWIQANAPSLFYSTNHVEEISKSPLFVKANEGKLETIQSVVNRQNGKGYSLSDVRRLQGLNVIEKGEKTYAGETQNPDFSTSSAVVGMAGKQFSWDTARGTGVKYRTPVGLVGFLTTVFSESKNERYRVRSTYYLKEDSKEGGEQK